MNENNESIKIFRCNICNKNYSSHSSLCNHNKKFHTINIQHNNNITQHNNNITQHNNNINESDYMCKYCSKIYKHQQSKSRHEKDCKIKLKNNDIKNNFKKLEQENIKIKNILKELLEKNCKIHPKTLQKINKQLINNTNNTTNNGTINNGPVINNTYVKFGNEQLASLLTRKDMLNIINKQCLCIEESIKTVHFNKSLPEYSNIFITNMKDTIAYIFDGSRFILTSKDTVINDLYNSHLENIEQFLEEAEIPENKYTKITKFLDVLNDDDKSFIDGTNNNKKYPNYKAYKLIAIKNLIYNESDQKLLKKLNNIDLQEKINDVPITESEE
uniref:C2H2-type domain-containing protein n=1 Tax=viral metagenome TaxID=1070528 RepID=A0A6C0EDQ3_9ZZZZ